MMSERFVIVIGAVLALALQLFIVPNIALYGIVPNVLAAFALAVAVTRPSSYGCVLPFVLGLAFDLVGAAPLGLMAFSIMVVSVAVARVFVHVDNDSRFMTFALIAIGALLVELVYGCLLLFFGYQASFFDALLYRILPCFLYDVVCGILLYLLLARFARPASVVRTELTQLR